MVIQLVSEIVEANGKTIRQNNMEKKHKIPIDTLVHFKGSDWFGRGAFMRYEGRFYVIAHNRDCDGAPLYTIGEKPREHILASLRELGYLEDAVGFEQLGCMKNFLLRYFFLWFQVSGIDEDSLTPVEITQEVLDGYHVFSWPEEL